MSYSFINFCYHCKRKDGCKDMEKVQEALNKMYAAQDGSHKGSGSIVLACLKLQSDIE